MIGTSLRSLIFPCSSTQPFNTVGDFCWKCLCNWFSIFSVVQMLKVDASHQPQALDVYCTRGLPHVHFSPGNVFFLDGVLGVALLRDYYFQLCFMEECYHPLILHSHPFPQPLQWWQAPCSCFCDSVIASNELRRNCTTGRVTAPGHVSTTLLAAQQSHPLLSVPLKLQMFSPNFSLSNFRNAWHQGSNNMGGRRRCPQPE